MKTKLFAMMLLAGGAVFAQPRVSIGVSVGGGGYGVSGFYQQPLPYPAYVAPCPVYYSWINGYCVQDYGYVQPYYGGSRYQVAPRFNNSYARQSFARGYQQSRNQNQYQNGGNRSGQGNRGNGSGNGSRRR